MWSRETATDGSGVGCLVIVCLSNLGRVNSCPHQHTAQIDKARTVQLQNEALAELLIRQRCNFKGRDQFIYSHVA